MLPTMQRSAIVACLGTLIAFAPEASASNAKAEVVLEIQRLESTIKSTRWNLNTLEEKKRLQNDLRLLRVLYDRIIEYEGDLMGFDCAGAIIDGEGGPPESTEGSDIAGLLSQQEITASRLAAQGSAPPPAPPPASSDGVSLPGRGLTFGGGIGFVRTITDVEVRLLAGLVMIEDRLANHEWHLNNQQEKQKLIAEKENLRASLRRLRNSRC
jgi:hypothetical protein